MRFRLRQREGETPRKSLFHVERKGSLYRHQDIYCLTDQCLIQGSLRQIRLHSSQFGWVKAAGGHGLPIHIVLVAHRLSGPQMREVYAT